MNAPGGARVRAPMDYRVDRNPIPQHVVHIRHVMADLASPFFRHVAFASDARRRLERLKAIAARPWHDRTLHCWVVELQQRVFDARETRFDVYDTKYVPTTARSAREAAEKAKRRYTRIYGGTWYAYAKIADWWSTRAPIAQRRDKHRDAGFVIGAEER